MKGIVVCRVVLASFAGTLLLLGTSAPSSATTFNSVTVDCNVNEGTEWLGDEDMGAGGMGTEAKLYITWDATYLYVGIVPPYYLITVYIDTASGGTSTGHLSATHQIANLGVGYEYAYSANDIGGSSRGVSSGGAWVDEVLPSGTDLCASGTGMEWAIPWADIGVSPGDQITLFVTDRSQPDTIDEYWPDVTGNVNPPPSFTQGFVFMQSIQAGVSPGGSPTAITLSGLAISGADKGQALIIGVAAVLGVILIIGQHQSRQ